MEEESFTSLVDTVDCPKCGQVLEVAYPVPEGVWEPQDIEEPPRARVKCTNPACENEWVQTYQGWSNYGDA